MSEVKFGHFVPQLHLRYFSFSEKEQLYCFDKSTSRQFVTPVKRAGGERHFYDIESQDHQFAEEAFNELEGTVGEWYKHAAYATPTTIAEHELKRLAPFIAAQSLRTKVVLPRKACSSHQTLKNQLRTASMMHVRTIFPRLLDRTQ